MSAPARLSEVMISKTAVRSSKIPFSAAAFTIIERDFAQRFVRVGRVHLIRTPISKLRWAFSGVAKRAVKHGGEFRGVTHDSSVGETAGVERFADCADAAVHHVARRDHVRARLRV